MGRVQSFFISRKHLVPLVRCFALLLHIIYLLFHHIETSSLSSRNELLQAGYTNLVPQLLRHCKSNKHRPSECLSPNIIHVRYFLIMARLFRLLVLPQNKLPMVSWRRAQRSTTRSSSKHVVHFDRFSCVSALFPISVPCLPSPAQLLPAFLNCY